MMMPTFSATLELLALPVTHTHWEVADSLLRSIGMSPGWDLLVTEYSARPLFSRSIRLTSTLSSLVAGFLFLALGQFNPVPATLCQLPEILTDTHTALLMAYQNP
jgi:hypothetical protein